MAERVEAKAVTLGCRRCGVDVAEVGDAYSHTLVVHEEASGRATMVMRLCGSCADDFARHADLEAYLERLVLA